MALAFLVVIGAILGWLAAIVVGAEDSRSLKLNVALGVGGALFAGLVVYPMVWGGDLLGGSYSVGGLVTALCGTVAVLFAAHLLRDREAR